MEEPEGETNQNSRYPVLETIVFIYQLLAVLAIVGALALILNIYLRADVFDTGVASAIGIVFVISIISSMILWASAEVISVFIHIEENTRKTTELLQMQMKIGNKN